MNRYFFYVATTVAVLYWLSFAFFRLIAPRLQKRVDRLKIYTNKVDGRTAVAVQDDFFHATHRGHYQGTDVSVQPTFTFYGPNVPAELRKYMAGDESSLEALLAGCLEICEQKNLAVPFANKRRFEEDKAKQRRTWEESCRYIHGHQFGRKLGRAQNLWQKLVQKWIKWDMTSSVTETYTVLGIVLGLFLTAGPYYVWLMVSPENEPTHYATSTRLSEKGVELSTKTYTTLEQAFFVDDGSILSTGTIVAGPEIVGGDLVSVSVRFDDSRERPAKVEASASLKLKVGDLIVVRSFLIDPNQPSNVHRVVITQAEANALVQKTGRFRFAPTR